MFFAKPGEFAPCGMYTLGHLIYFILSVIGIILALFLTRKVTHKTVKKTIVWLTLVLWLFEVIKIVFTIFFTDMGVNSYIPLYYCSLVLYAGLMSSFGKGLLKRVGDVFLCTGSIIGGAVFICCPMTSLTNYPALHFISMQSFVLHSAMIYIGLLILITGYVKLEYKDVLYNASVVIVAGILAYIFNIFFNSNLMFVSENFPGTPLEIVYNLTKPIYPFIMIVFQAFPPFYFIFFMEKLFTKLLKK